MEVPCYAQRTETGIQHCGHAMILGIDASNIRADGVLTDLVELLGAAEPADHGFAEVPHEELCG